MKLYSGDCLEIMKSIPDSSVDLILCDLPYGTTKCPWDIIIPFDKLWEQYHRIAKPTAAIVLFGQEPFSTVLRSSNLHEYKYDWYWVKEAPTNIFQMKRRPGKIVETISVFYKEQPTYNQQRTTYTGKPVVNNVLGRVGSLVGGKTKTKLVNYKDNGTRCPTQILKFNRVPRGKTIHPTQKPVELLEYLIKTYTNEGDVVLDNCMGSGSCGIACLNLKREFIGIELNDKYFTLAKERISNHKLSV